VAYLAGEALERRRARFGLRKRRPLIQELAIADWLEELVVYATARRFQDAETAYHLSQAIKHWYLVRLAIDHCPVALAAFGVSPKHQTIRRSGSRQKALARFRTKR
jgi:hypothetical protein